MWVKPGYVVADAIVTEMVLFDSSLPNLNINSKIYFLIFDSDIYYLFFWLI